MGARYFEDVTVGERHTSDGYAVDREQIVDFARQYDPQPFHVDEAAGEASIFGGLVASGFQTLAICARLATDAFLSDVAIVGGRSLSDVAIHHAVRPGDTLTCDVAVTEKTVPDDHPKYGHLEVDVTGRNQDGREVASFGLQPVLRRREYPD